MRRDPLRVTRACPLNKAVASGDIRMCETYYEIEIEMYDEKIEIEMYDERTGMNNASDG